MQNQHMVLDGPSTTFNAGSWLVPSLLLVQEALLRLGFWNC